MILRGTNGILSNIFGKSLVKDMTTEIALQDNSIAKQKIVQLISNNISAIPLIAEHIKISEDLVSALISELVEEGVLKGTISQDGLRFYRSDIKMPTILEESIEEPQKDSSMLMIPKAIVITGISLFIAGQIFVRIFEVGTSLRDTAAGLVFLGLIAIFGGLFTFTKFEAKN